MRDHELSIRGATPDDASSLAELIDRAGEGIPSYLWSSSAGEGESALDVGKRRAAREEGGFSYRNAHIAEAQGQVAGMLLGYPLPDPYPEEDLSSLPSVVRPLVELEALAPGSWYVNAVAVYPVFEGRGYGKRLMELAESLARECGAAALSLIVAEENAKARAMYEHLGYEIAARRSIVPFPGLERTGDWVLMRMPVPRPRPQNEFEGGGTRPEP